MNGKYLGQVAFLWLASVTLVDAAILYDPTLPPGQQQTETSSSEDEQGSLEQLKLQQVVHGPHHHLAVINGRRLSPGEQIAGFRLVWVADNRICLERDGQRHYLSLYSDLKLKH